MTRYKNIPGALRENTSVVQYTFSFHERNIHETLCTFCENASTSLGSDLTEGVAEKERKERLPINGNCFFFYRVSGLENNFDNRRPKIQLLAESLLFYATLSERLQSLSEGIKLG